MSVVRRALRGTPARRALGDSGITLQTAFGGMFSDGTDAGPVVTIPKASGLPAVGAAIRRISRDIGTMPLVTYSGPAEDLVEVPRDPTALMLRIRWNDQMTAVVALTTLARHLIGWGQGFVGKDLVGLSGGREEVTGLWPIAPERVTVTIDRGVKVFRVITDTGGVKEFSDREIIHVLLDSDDGYEGLSPIAQHRQAMGHQLGLQMFGSKSIANRAVPSGYLRIKKAIADKSKRTQLREEWDALYRGSAKSHRTAILDEDAEFVAVSLPLVDAQFVEQRNFSIVEVAQIFGMPVHKLQGTLGTGASLTYNTREGNQLEYLTDALRPPMVAIEAAFNADRWLFPPARKLSCGLVDRALLRMDALTLARVNAIELGGAPIKRPSETRHELGLPADSEFDYAPTKAGPVDAHMSDQGKGASGGSGQ